MGGTNYPKTMPADNDETLWVLKDRSDKLKKIEQSLLTLKSHPNFKELTPLKGEELLPFTLRYIAHLVSPPMYDGESNEMECIDISKAILSSESEILSIWVQSIRRGGVNEREIKVD